MLTETWAIFVFFNFLKEKHNGKSMSAKIIFNNRKNMMVKIWGPVGEGICFAFPWRKIM